MIIFIFFHKKKHLVICLFIIFFNINLRDNFKLTIMKNKTIKMLLFYCGLCTSVVFAQDTPIEVKPVKESTTIPVLIKEKKNSIAVYGGLPGYGIGYGRKINDHFTARINYSTFTLGQNIENLEFSNRKVNASLDFDYQAIDLFMDFLPSKKSSFKFVVGASYLSNMETSILIAAASGEQFGDITIAAKDIGDISVNAKWSGIAPYVAMGFGRTVPKHRVGFGFEIGGHFLGKSDFTFNATKSLVPLNETEKETKDFENFINAITFLPTLKFHLAYKF
jgi:hypothetical protein